LCLHPRAGVRRQRGDLQQHDTQLTPSGFGQRPGVPDRGADLTDLRDRCPARSRETQELANPLRGSRFTASRLVVIPSPDGGRAAGPEPRSFGRRTTTPRSRSTGAHAQHDAALELRNGSFVPLRGDLDANSLYVDSSLSTNSGLRDRPALVQHPHPAGARLGAEASPVPSALDETKRSGAIHGSGGNVSGYGNWGNEEDH
jgi:hypothetical protein